MMEFSGYGIRVWWDGATLRVHGKTKAARVALLGEDHEQGDLVLDRGQIRQASYKKAGLLTNGRVVIRDIGGRKYILHFLRKHSANFAILARDLGAVGV